MSQKRNRRPKAKRHGGGLATFRRQPRKPARPMLSITVMGLLIIGWTIVWTIIQYEPATAPEDADVIVYVTSSCKCYRPWIQQLRRDGLAVSALQTRDIIRKQASLGIPREFSACHTAVANGYWLEGHVTAAAIAALTSKAPDDVAGLAHLRANVKSTERVTYEIVSYDTSGRPLSSAPQRQSADENEQGVTHDGQ